MEVEELCLDCLRNQIQTDFSDNLILNYALPSSALPFASNAVVQVSKPEGEVSPQFILMYLSIHHQQQQQQHCFTNYINGHCPEDLTDNNYLIKDNAPLAVLNQDQNQASTENSIDKPTPLETKPAEPQILSNDGGKTFLPGLGCNSSTCNFSKRFSCLRTLTALAPVSQIGLLSYPAFEELTSSFLSGIIEDHVLHSLTHLIQGKATGRDSINFLNLVGVPSFTDSSFPGCIRHPNIVPVLSMMKSYTHINLILPKTSYTLQNILHYSPDALKSNWHIKFLMYQLLSPLRYMHGLGIAHGSICPSNVLITDSFWCWLHISDTLQSNSVIYNGRKIGCYTEGCHSSELYADLKLSHPTDWDTVFIRWWNGELTNFDYLIFLNKLAGRRWGDHTFHTVMPWVIDFSVKPDENNDTGWRNLSKSKWRLAKGDEQLDFTYLTSEIPHHVSDECLSEVAVCSYKARRLPLSVLRTAVRSVYEPNEYPSTMHRLYQWTPDECIPEFYFDPRVFHSRHSGMSNLAVPSWASCPEEFIRLHRDALESNRVSCQIHDWIDIIFGYKMSGKAAVSAKNVMLPPSEPTSARSVGRRQLFSQPHPARWGIKNKVDVNKHMLRETSNLQALEEAATFIEHASHLSPVYKTDLGKDNSGLDAASETIEYGRDSNLPSIIDINFLLQTIEADDGSSSGYQDFLLWREKASRSTNLSVDIANDVFSIGCIFAELHLRKPLFNPTSLAQYLNTGVLPKLMHELPSQVSILVESCIQKEWKRRPSVKSLLESPYFPATVRSSYLFIAPLQLLSKDVSRLNYVASFAKSGAFKLMGTFAAEMCAPHCLPLLLAPLADNEAEWGYIMLKEFLKCMNLQAAKALILPVIQKILQMTGYSHMKVSILQDSFVRELWNKIGKQIYLENIHSMVLSNLFLSPHKSSSGAASVLLVGSSDELGVPVTVNQTILPLIRFFGKGLCSDGIDVLVKIGGLFGETFIVKQILPLLKNVVRSCMEVPNVSRPEPMQSWSSLALMDCLMTLDGIVELLPNEVVVKELIEDGGCLFIQLLMIANLGMPSLQVAATSLVSVSQQIGPELTSLYVMPKLKEVFEKLAFSEDCGTMKVSKNKVQVEQMENRMDLVLLLYPPFASLLGIEKLRQCCSTWLILEQYLLWNHNWKWEYTEETSRGAVDNVNARRGSCSKNTTPEYNQTKNLLHGVGWSTPQSQVDKGAKKSMPHKRQHHNVTSSSTSREQEPWLWFPSPAPSWDGPGFLGRIGASSNEIPWKISASVIHSVRAHHGALRSFAIYQDECSFFTAGVGPGFKGSVQKWDLARIASSPGYDGHEEVVNDICVLSTSERTASCDGTIHIWNSQSGKNISVIAENPVEYGSSLSSVSRVHSDQANMLDFSSLGSGILSSAYDGSLYTCMHHLETVNRLVAGTGNSSLRFIDVDQGQKLHLWRSDSTESSFPSLVSTICSCGSTEMQTKGGANSPSWIAAGLSSGHCRLLDMRSGNLITSWQAHDGYVTKLAAPEDHLLVSSSLDKTLRVWDLRKNVAAPLTMFRGHTDGISGFSLWEQDIISISRSKIGLSSLSQQDGQHRIMPQYLYMSDRESRNMSVLSNITILPFSRLFLVGTEDGYLKVCC